MSMPAETAAITPCVSFILAVKVGQIWGMGERIEEIQTSFVRTSEQEESNRNPDWDCCRKRHHHRWSKGSGFGGKCRYPCAQRQTLEQLMERDGGDKGS